MVGMCVLSSADELTELDSGVEVGSLAASAEDGSLVSGGRLLLGILEDDSWVVMEIVLDVVELLLVFDGEELLELVL